MRPFPPRSRPKYLPHDPVLSYAEQEFVARIFQQAGLNHGAYRDHPIQRRIRACLRALGSGSLGEATHRLDEQPQLLHAALGGFLIGTTSFFRDPRVFACLEREVLPGILAKSAKPHIWSAGCSEGAELYSIAILLHRLEALNRAFLLGTDCRFPAIRRARAGIFRSPGHSCAASRPACIREDSSASLDLSTYLRSTQRGIQVRPELINRVEFRQSDLLGCRDDQQWDLILCRNLLIYLKPFAAADLCRRLCQALKPGGFLVLGTAEKPSSDVGLLRVSSCIYRREGSSPCN